MENYSKLLLALKIITPLLLLCVVIWLVFVAALKKMFKYTMLEVVPVVSSYGMLGMFLGFCVGVSDSPLLNSVLGLLVPVVTGTLGVVYKDRQGLLDRYIPLALVAVTAQLFCMIISMIYIKQVYN